jgi:hypothetical protein
MHTYTCRESYRYIYCSSFTYIIYRHALVVYTCLVNTYMHFWDFERYKSNYCVRLPPKLAWSTSLGTGRIAQDTAQLSSAKAEQRTRRRVYDAAKPRRRSETVFHLAHDGIFSGSQLTHCARSPRPPCHVPSNSWSLRQYISLGRQGTSDIFPIATACTIAPPGMSAKICWPRNIGSSQNRLTVQHRLTIGYK